MYVIAGEEYSSKEQIRERCRGILQRAQQLPHYIDDRQTVRFLTALLSRHPEAQQKVGCGIHRFYIDKDGYGGRCFWLERKNGSRTDWSIKSCLTPPSHHDDVIAAFRWLIHPQILAFKNKAYDERVRVLCALTGEEVSKEHAHIDHKPPQTFILLVQQFMEENKITEEQLVVVPTSDGATFDTFSDESVNFAWMAFHRERAELQVTTAAANLRQAADLKRTAVRAAAAR